MTSKPNLIFDAGGVLVFPNFERLAKIGEQASIQTNAKELANHHAKLFHAYDEHVAMHHVFPKLDYFLNLYEQVTQSSEKAKVAKQFALQAGRKEHLWATTYPWVEESLRKLKTQGYPMAVISNSEGSVEQILMDLGLRKYFEVVIDSFLVGVEKPEKRIFEIALERLGWESANTIYIGDIFFVDVWGANQAGLGAIHLDKLGLYSNWDGIHIPSVKELPELLAKIDGNYQAFDFYPAKNFEIRS